MSFHSLFFTQANTRVSAQYKKCFQHVQCTTPIDGRQTSAHAASAENAFSWLRVVSLTVVRKQLVTEAVALRVVDSSGRQVTLHIGSRISKYFHFESPSVPPYTHTCMHTQFPSFLLHLISGSYSLVVFLCYSSDFGRCWLNQTKQDSGGMKGAVQLPVGSGEHFCGLIPADKEGAAV